MFCPCTSQPPLCCTVLCRGTPLCHATLCCATLCRTVPAVLCHTVHTVPPHAVPCHALTQCPAAADPAEGRCEGRGGPRRGAQEQRVGHSLR